MQPTRIVRRKELREITGLSTATLYRLMKVDFPAPIRLSRQAVGWELAAVLAWIESRKAAAP